ncbi:hypothetical protein CT157_16990 [Pseudomonas syringae]|uniref:Uncharacterized protein n=1 Tax=Pseudomonas syringae TaxID=317 RepID=A0A3T0JVZ5_PSESX|nr:hypothetical protein CT157_16990 [Pseudomonas syringae]
MSQKTEEAYFDIKEAVDNDIKLKDVPDGGATIRVFANDLENPSGVPFYIHVMLDDLPGPRFPASTPVTLPFEVTVSRRELLDFVGKQVDIKCRINFGGNLSELGPDSYRIVHN